MQQELFPDGTRLTDRHPRARRYGLFFALMPAPGAARQIAAFAPEGLAITGAARQAACWRFIEAGRLHLSLHLVREQRNLDRKFIALAEQVAQRISSPGFELAFDMMATFPAIPTREKKRALVLLADHPALRDLFARLGAEMRRIGLPALADFAPHMTLAYGPRAVAPQPVPPLRVPFSDFVLIKSAKGAHHYDICNRWPLLPE